MSGVEYIIGSKDLKAKSFKPYNPEIISFCADFSSALMKSPFLRKFTDISALAFWCRKSNINKMKEDCPEADERLGRGLCFHIAPGNIPINFAFSYLFGLLAGCSNLVRLPSRDFPQIMPVVEILAETLVKYPETEENTAFVKYTANNEITAKFCAEADARLIWGGDKTIELIRSMSVKPRCVDVCFADRYSICIINPDSVLKADESALKRLAENFYNDTYLMDQNACSSPQLILWTGGDLNARKRFWDAVYKTASARYEISPSLAVDKYTRMCEDALNFDSLEKVQRRGNLLYLARLKKPDSNLTDMRGAGGYFYEYSIENFDEIAPYVTEKYQTVTYFGTDPKQIQKWVIDNGLPGIDRIVPVGKALDIGIMWDGFDLVRVLSRLVTAE